MLVQGLRQDKVGVPFSILRVWIVSHGTPLLQDFMRDSLPVQLHDTMLQSSKKRVSAHEDSLFSITIHMLSHGSTYLPGVR